ncbi:hypothetical protein ACVRY7_08720 [Streptococcus ictaluri]|uniref:Uncharacterized protein n=1 Tax=Streptococcus ictaluri 707-05 TaxID=764299 RepID=G5K0X6_9STRE|nr:hypothetical protein [Streptococcus ictaluri]EHI70378.1 hypothetical protein STRIC_0252 [Streptococcus ictaluri 707-05]
MGLFNKNEKSPKKSMAEIYLEQHGISNLPDKYAEPIKNIVNDLSAQGLGRASLALSFSKIEEQTKVGYLSTIVKQNWILMDQNQQIINELKKLNDK